jgi:hypothetical protein
MENLFEKLARASDSDQQAVSVGIIAIVASVGGAVLISAFAL